MLYAKNSIETCDLNQLQENLYQIDQSKNHLKDIHLSLEEALYHLKKFNYHVSLIEDVDNILNLEVSNG
jgi:hypothetical protein